MITYLALGTRVAWGQLTRTAAICRNLLDLGAELDLYVSGDMTPLDYHGIPYTRLDSPHEAFERNWAGRFLVVDSIRTFRGADVYVTRFGRPEPRGDHIIRAEPYGGPGPFYWPMLCLREEEILTREQARAELGWNQDAHLRVWVPSGYGIEPPGPYDVVLDRYPALRWLRAADVVLGACGTNLYGEVRYLGLQAEWTWGHREQQTRLTELIPHRPDDWVIMPDAARRAAEYILAVQRGQA